MGELGYDKFFAEPDTVDSINCRVCGTRCDVERSVIGPTSLAEAYAMRGRWHDILARTPTSPGMIRRCG